MAQRFGASHAAHAAQAKMRFALGLLVTMILFLFGVLVFVLTQLSSTQSAQASAGQGTTPSDESAQPIMPTVPVLVASGSYAVGTQITETVLSVKQEEQSAVPKGALLLRDKEQIIGMFLVNPISSRQHITRDDLARFAPISQLKLPAGYRAVTINVDSRSGVEGWAKPDTKVDVIFAFEDEGKKKVITLLEQIKVLSFSGSKKTDAERAEVGGKDVQTTVTLQVTERDAKKLELARINGQLSLILCSDGEPEKEGEERKEVIDLQSIIGQRTDVPVPAESKVAPVEEEEEGIAYYPDPRTGEMRKLVLKKGSTKWREVESESW